MNDSATKTSGKGLFLAGCITLAIFSAVHMIPMSIAMFVEPTKPAEAEAKRAMSAVVIDMGPFHTNWAKLSLLLSASYSALLFFVVTVNLVALPAVVAHGRLRALAAVNAVFVGGLLVIALVYRFPPPGVFALIAGALFVGSTLRAAGTMKHDATSLLQAA